MKTTVLYFFTEKHKTHMLHSQLIGIWVLRFVALSGFFMMNSFYLLNTSQEPGPSEMRRFEKLTCKFSGFRVVSVSLHQFWTLMMNQFSFGFSLAWINFAACWQEQKVNANEVECLLFWRLSSGILYFSSLPAYHVYITSLAWVRLPQNTTRHELNTS